MNKNSSLHGFEANISFFPAGFNGTNCENNIDDCPGHQCANGGICMDGVNTYNCQCPPEWTGKSQSDSQIKPERYNPITFYSGKLNGLKKKFDKPII